MESGKNILIIFHEIFFHIQIRKLFARFVKLWDMDKKYFIPGVVSYFWIRVQVVLDPRILLQIRLRNKTK